MPRWHKDTLYWLVEGAVIATADRGKTWKKISDLKGVVQLAKLDAKRALILTQAQDGAMNLNTIDLP